MAQNEDKATANHAYFVDHRYPAIETGWLHALWASIKGHATTNNSEKNRLLIWVKVALNPK